MNFEELLTVDQRKEILENRLVNFAVEAYQISLNKKIAEIAKDPSGIEQTENALKTLQSAIDVYKEELANISA